MIKKVDIPNFGLFKDYKWDNSVGNTYIFRRINVIYGRNYSGKTTLSRIFKSIENGFLHKDYSNGTFTITLSDGSVLTNLKLETDFRIRVYNSDFVKDNLSWLHKDDGTIRPFTILGARNIELDKQIKEIEARLGSIEAKSGLLYDLDEKQKECRINDNNYQTKRNNLEEKLRKAANDEIKVNNSLFLISPSKRTYTITDIRSEIEVIEKNISKYILTDDDVEERSALLSEFSLDNINLLPVSTPSFSKYYGNVKELLNKKIKPSIPIIDLLNDSLLQEWVRQGIGKHRGKKTTCGFCGNYISDELWERLDAHFSQESEELRREIKQQIDELEKSKERLSSFHTLTKDRFYPSLSLKFEIILSDWKSATTKYINGINELIAQLKERENNIFKEKQLLDIADASQEVFNNIKAFNELINEHNTKTDTLASDQSIARNELRKSYIAQFLLDNNYQFEVENIKQAKDNWQQANDNLASLNVAITILLEEKTKLEMQAKDESKGAALVNQHLSHFFGHNELKLKAEGETPNIKFIIQRENKDATNLSEGECSLISFCYFIAKLEDELQDEHNCRKLIIYIDDPISSLDSNHIFFMFSLIESIIAKPKKYGQLFISTHNLDFLKYLRKLTIPRRKLQLGSKDEPDSQHFIIDRKNRGNTSLKTAPDYLKKYVTEFNYLFEQIYNCTIADAATIAQEYQYSFGNNMRKFLEAYLFYKYPSHKLSKDEKLRKFLCDDTVSVNLINRVINEYSHIGEHFDRGMEPIDIDEIGKIATLVLNKIKELDSDQYEALLESVNKP